MKSSFRLIGVSDSEVLQKLEFAYDRLFHGDGERERICFPAEGALLYVEDVGHGDIRSEGMSYGMFLSASLGYRAEFDALWNFSKKYLRNDSGDFAPYFAWQVGIPACGSSDFFKMDSGAAPDGEEYFAAALLLAERIFRCPAYGKEASDLLWQMAHKISTGKVRAMFDPENFLVRFSPMAGNDFTDPSYHTLAFYRFFAQRTGDAFGKDAYAASVSFLLRAIHKETGLAPDYAEFDGSPKRTDFFPTSECFSGDAWRVALNLALDFSAEFPGEDEAVRASAKKFERDSVRRLLSFFSAQDAPLSDYAVDGSPFSGVPRPMTPGLLAMNAAATLALDLDSPLDRHLAKPVLEAFWNSPVPSGTWRYYDGMLYLLGLLALSPKSFSRQLSTFCI